MQFPSPISYLAFDLGASSGRAVLGTFDGEHMRMETIHRFTTPVLEEDERLFWDLEVLWEEMREGLRLALRVAPLLKSLSVDSWAVDYVPLGTDGQPLRNPYSYRDPRTARVMEQALRRVPKADVYRTTGIQFLPFNTLYQVLADREMEPERVAQTASRLLVADYFHYRFCGRATAELSMASTTQLLDARTHEWAAGLMERFDIDPATWPEIVPPGTRLGKIRNSKFEIRNSKPEVVAGCSHDTACAVAAVPAESERSWAYVSCGTWSLLGAERSEPLLGAEAREAGFTNEVGLDGRIRFLKNLTGLWALQECVREWRQDDPVDYDALLTEAEAAPARTARIDLEDERFLGRGDMEARLKHYCRETGQRVPATRGALTRVILESIAESYRRALGELEAVTGQAAETVHLVGGGARNDLLCRLTARTTGREVVAGPAEATALGNLLIQARAMDDLPAGCTVRDVARRSTRLKHYTPRQTSVA